MMLDFLRSKCIDFNLVVCGISFRKGVLRQWWSRFSGDIAAIYMPRTLYGREKCAQQDHREIWGTTLQAGKGSSGKMERGKSSFSYMMSQKASTPEIWMEWLWCRQEGSIFLHWLDLFRVCHWSNTLASDSGDGSSKTPSSGSQASGRHPGDRVRGWEQKTWVYTAV